MIWVLILTFVSNKAPGVIGSTAAFHTKDECEKVGAQWKRLSSPSIIITPNCREVK